MTSATHEVPDAVPDLSRPRRVHLVAIGGAGMSAIATVLHEQGHLVSGSDLAVSDNVERLRSAGVRVEVGHRREHVADAEVVVVSSAVPDDNVEVVAARDLGVPVLGRRSILSAFGRRQPLLSVSGTHGKTTTASMLAVALRGAGVDPSFLIGAPVASLGAAAATGAGPWFVLEADESDASFLAGPRAGAIVTNVDRDHLEFWGGWDELVEGFGAFLEGTDGPRVLCADDATAARLAARLDAVTYGVGADAAYRVEEVGFDRGSSRFTLRGPARAVEVRLAVPGMHNVLDAAAALTLAAELGVDLPAAVDALGGFSGAARRFERRGHLDGIDLVDDYAHLPEEIAAVLAAGRTGGWTRVVVTFQPHRYSRTQALWRELATSLLGADVVVVTEVYPAGEAPRPGVDGRLVFDELRRVAGGPEVRWAEDLESAAVQLSELLRPGDLCLSIGAGDVTTLPDLLARRWERAGRGHAR